MSEERPERPNIIWIMADDLSWGDPGCFGQERILTPNIDRLAAEGMRFTQCHSGSPLCAPSRSSLMQGLHQGHATVRDNAAPGGYRHTLQPDDVTVAEVLQEAGYACGLFGKWGLAVWDQPGIPNNKGFDEFCGYLNQRKAHNYYPEYLWRNQERIYFPQHRGHNHKEPNEYDDQGRIIPNGMDDPDSARYSFDVYAEASEEFVRDNHDRPFFLYLAYTIPHLALEVPELGPYTDLDWPTLSHKIWAGMITRMDDAVGRLLDLLEELGCADDTLIFFTSDNGYSMAGLELGPSLDEFFHHRGPWKGAKGNCHQGGVRVPTVARWPNRIQSGTTSDHPWAFWDLMPTAAELAGVSPPADIDGVSIAPTLVGEPERQRAPEYLYWELRDEQAVRLEDWYAYRPHPERPIELYHALEDPEEERDLAADMPGVVDEVEAIMREAHTPTLYFPGPGQTRQQWKATLQEAGIALPENIDR
ncbi:MAG: arylsulfatase [Armatimonadota bacterium]|nr:arylsulfatase [Armatimonadota bacterium]